MDGKERISFDVRRARPFTVSTLDDRPRERYMKNNAATGSNMKIHS